MKGRYTEVLEILSPENLATLARDDLGVLSFHHLIPALESIRKDLIAAEDMSEADFPANQLSNAGQALKPQLADVLQRMLTWDPRQESNSSSAHQSITSQVLACRDTIAQTIRPYLRHDPVDIASSARKSADLFQRLQENVAESDRILNETKTAAVQRASDQISGYYKQAADDHRKTSKRYLWSAGSMAILLFAAVLFVFFILPPTTTANNQPIPTQSFVRDVVGRITVLVLGASALAFCARNYRINKHLEVINRTRYNALETAKLYVASVSEDSRNLVVAELVRAIFSPGDTGYMNTDREQTVVENPGSMVGFLAATNRQPR